MKANLHYFFLLIIGILASSCGDDATCLDRDTSIVKIKFIDEDGADKDIILIALRAIDNENGFPEYEQDTLSRLSLPLNPGSRTTTFLLDRAEGTDTLGLSYDVVAQLISPECGLDAAFSNLDTTNVSFEQVNIVSSIINEEIITNIEITH